MRADEPVASRRMPCNEKAFERASVPPVALVKNTFVLEAVEAKEAVLVTFVAATLPNVAVPLTSKVPVAVRLSV